MMKALRWIGTVISLAILAYIIDWPTMLRHLLHLNVPWCIASLSACALVILVMGLRWSIIIRAVGIPVRTEKICVVTFIAQFLNNILPGSTGGDLYKAWQAARWTDDERVAAVTTIVYDRIIGVCSLFLTAIAALLIQQNDYPELRRLLGKFFLALVFAISCIVLLSLAFPFLKKYIRFTVRKPQLTGGRLLISWRMLALALIASIAAHVTNCYSVYCIARSMSIPLDLLQCAVALAIVQCGTMLPISIAGHGLREASFIFAFGLYGLKDAAGGVAGIVAFSAVFFLRGILASFPGTIFMIWTGWDDPVSESAVEGQAQSPAKAEAS